jgi:hypothetical protein
LLLASLLAELAEKRDVVPKHGIVGAGMLHGCIEFAFDAGDGLKKELAEIGKRVGGLVRDAFFGESGEDFAEYVVYVGDGVELAGKGSELGGELVGFEKLLLFAGMEEAESRMVFFAEHAAGTAVGELAKTLVAVGIGGIWLHWNLRIKRIGHRDTESTEEKSCRKTSKGCC